MKKRRVLTMLFLAFSIGVIAARYCAAQNSGPGKKADESNPAMERLTALVSYLETNKQTNALKLFYEYSNASLALQHSADMGVMLHLLMALHQGQTTNAMELLEGRLDMNIIGFAATYRELPTAQRNWLGLHSLSEARLYREKFPHKHRYQNIDEGVAQAFQLLDDRTGK